MQEKRWFGVRLVFHHAQRGVFEERILLWETEAAEVAIALAEREGDRYATQVSAERLPFAQLFELFDPPQSGIEVFSLMRESALASKEYLDTFFATGSERQRTIDS